MPANRVWLGLAVVTLGLSGCASEKAAQKSESAAAPSADSSMGTLRASPNAKEKVEVLDLNSDSKPDVWSYSVEAKGPDGKSIHRVVRKELDINWDGRVDITKFYDDRENVNRELMDLDFDGKVDVVTFYEKGVVVRKERDLDSNSKPDLWIYYEKARLVRKERDSNADGKVDYWEYWENDQVDRVGEDLDGDGKVDKWTQTPRTES